MGICQEKSLRDYLGGLGLFGAGGAIGYSFRQGLPLLRKDLAHDSRSSGFFERVHSRGDCFPANAGDFVDAGCAGTGGRTGSEGDELPKITPEMMDQAAALAGVGPFTAEQKQMMLDGLNEQRDAYEQIRALKLANGAAGVCVSSGAAAGSGTSLRKRVFQSASKPMRRCRLRSIRSGPATSRI